VGINEVDAMILEILEPLRLVPLEPHLQSVYTAPLGHNRESCCPITPQFSGRALTHVTWHFIPPRPLQLLVMRLAQHCSGPRLGTRNLVDHHVHGNF
jgi:hypothetical protein